MLICSGGDGDDLVRFGGMGGVVMIVQHQRQHQHQSDLQHGLNGKPLDAAPRFLHHRVFGANKLCACVCVCLCVDHKACLVCLVLRVYVSCFVDVCRSALRWASQPRNLCN